MSLKEDLNINFAAVSLNSSLHETKPVKPQEKDSHSLPQWFSLLTSLCQTLGSKNPGSCSKISGAVIKTERHLPLLLIPSYTTVHLCHCQKHKLPQSATSPEVPSLYCSQFLISTNLIPSSYPNSFAMPLGTPAMIKTLLKTSTSLNIISFVVIKPDSPLKI